MVTSSLQKQMSNPLNAITNQSQIVQMICKEFFTHMVEIKDCVKLGSFDALTNFYDMMYDASMTFKASSNIIRLNIGNILNYN